MKRLTGIGNIFNPVNAYKLQFDETLLNEIRESYRQDLQQALDHPDHRHLFEGGIVHRGYVGEEEGNYFLTTYGKNPLLWFASNNDETYQIYNRFLHALNIEDDIKELVDYKENILLYCGFFVVGDQAPEESWHVDYFPGANAYTLITPLFEIDRSQGNLLYHDSQGQVESYTYKPGEAILFGDNFMHTTEKYMRTDSLRVLVSLQLGSDKMEHWDVLKKTIASQSKYLIQPCGHVRGTCEC